MRRRDNERERRKGGSDIQSPEMCPAAFSFPGHMLGTGLRESANRGEVLQDLQIDGRGRLPSGLGRMLHDPDQFSVRFTGRAHHHLPVAPV